MKPKTPAISVRGETYKRLRYQAQQQGTTITNLAERLIVAALDSMNIASEKQVRVRAEEKRYDETPPAIQRPPFGRAP